MRCAPRSLRTILGVKETGRQRTDGRRRALTQLQEKIKGEPKMADLKLAVRSLLEEVKERQAERALTGIGPCALRRFPPAAE